MKTGIICCRPEGAIVKEKISTFLARESEKLIFWLPGETEENDSMAQWVEVYFQKLDAMIFIGDCDTALRSCAHLVRSKKTDPAVLIVDEQGKFVVSLMSGHIGGANELAGKIAGFLEAVPVITTATDLNRKFAVDVFATKNQCSISSMPLAKELSAALVNGERIGFYSEFPWNGKIPDEIVETSNITEEDTIPEIGFCVTADRKKCPFPKTLYLNPKIVTIGIGCKKNTPEETIEKIIKTVCDREKISLDTVEQAASIDLKKDEPGLLAFCKKYHLPFITFTKEELMKVPGTFTASAFVKKVTGVDNVCERSALLAGSRLGGESRLIVKKYAEEGVTAAIAVRKWSVRFE